MMLLLMFTVKLMLKSTYTLSSTGQGTLSPEPIALDDTFVPLPLSQYDRKKSSNVSFNELMLSRP